MGYSPSLTCIANRLKAIKAKRSIVSFVEWARGVNEGRGDETHT